MEDFAEEHQFSNTGIELPAVTIFQILPSDSLKSENILASTIHHMNFSKNHESLSKGSPDDLPQGLSEPLLKEFLKDLMNFKNPTEKSQAFITPETIKKHILKKITAFHGKRLVDKISLEESREYLTKKAHKCINPTDSPEEYSKEVDCDTVAVMLCNSTCYIAANVKVRASVGKNLKYKSIGLTEEIAAQMAHFADCFFTDSEERRCGTSIQSISKIIILQAQLKDTVVVSDTLTEQQKSAKCHAEMQCMAKLEQLEGLPKDSTIELGVSGACCAKCIEELTKMQKSYTTLVFPNLTLNPPDSKHRAFMSTDQPKTKNWESPKDIEVKEFHTLIRTPRLISSVPAPISTNPASVSSSLVRSHFELGRLPPTTPATDKTSPNAGKSNFSPS